MINNDEIDIIGFSDDGRAYGILSRDRIHTAIFGESGAGKSETMKLLILQCIKRRHGFMLIDAHGTLAREVLMMIPRELWSNTVYINPATAIWFKRVISVNPLECRDEEDKHVVVMSFLNVLKNLYSDSWGDRLETILRNALNVLLDVGKEITLKDLRSFIINQEFRDSILRNVTDLDALHFWYEIFEKNYKKEAVGVVYNKLDKILSTPLAMFILNSRLGIDIGQMMREGKFIVVDLADIASDDIVAFLGSLLIHLVYVEAKRHSRHSTSSPPTPFNLFIDEAHLFPSFAIREVLNTLRKFNVKVTIATQSINSLPDDIAKEIPALCRTIICFKCDIATVTLFKSLLPLSRDEMLSLSLHEFAFYSHSSPPVTGIAMSKKITVKEYNNWLDVARFSVEIHGNDVGSVKRVSDKKMSINLNDEDMSRRNGATLARLDTSNMKTKAG
ncbi:MAG: DUF87 domain-containing protein [Nitrososphaera sp.]|jgi:type IV secretory pathway VirB4 component|uniref:type IV secretory system conjugative DNA transfer family protein n=1 Tax=Candidatus Nitrosocaldus islandicus TaxID=2045011 RepID=UPI000CD09E82|nr:DUF87 domain-containing protein [Candidatus Nitrosocaldus islandicus]